MTWDLFSFVPCGWRYVAGCLSKDLLLYYKLLETSFSRRAIALSRVL